jgi:hypothetical protein
VVGVDGKADFGKFRLGMVKSRVPVDSGGEDEVRSAFSKGIFVRFSMFPVAFSW